MDRIQVKKHDQVTSTSKENQTTGGNVTPSNLTEIKGGAENTYYYDKDSMENIKEVVNIQQAGNATEPGIYVNVPAGISDVKVNGVALDATAIQGAGTWIYLSKLTKRKNNVEITYAGGVAKITITNMSMPEGSDVTTTDTTTTPQQTTGLQTTPTNVTTPQQTKITIKQTTTSQVTTKKIKLKAPVIKKITKASKKINIKFKKITVSGGYYQIQYSTNGKYKKAKTVNVKASKTKVTIKRLKRKKKYFVRARLYRKVKINGKTKKIYSAWSKTKNIRIK